MIITKICLVFLFITILHSLYFVFTGFFVFLKNKTKINHFSPKTKFCILIAARNEEKVIKTLIESLKKQNYPNDLIEIITLVNNCTDNTLKIAKKAGSNIMEIQKEVHTKGEVLTYAINELKNRNYDAYIVFDADNIVDKDFISIMNDVYQSGYKIAQGRKDSQNASDNWISSSYSLFHYFQNFFYNKARTHLTWNSAINGTGFMADKKFMEEKFKPKTITEDVELSIIATLHNEKVIYIDNAITYDEQPTKFKISLTQRLRWSKGIMQCFKIYKKDLLKSFIKTNNFSNIDKIMFLLVPYIQVLSFIMSLILCLNTLKDIGLTATISQVFGSIFFVIGAIIEIVFNALILKHYDNRIISNWHGILLFSLFVLTWIPINIYCIFKKNITWKQIEHGQKKVTN